MADACERLRDDDGPSFDENTLDYTSSSYEDDLARIIREYEESGLHPPMAQDEPTAFLVLMVKIALTKGFFIIKKYISRYRYGRKVVELVKTVKNWRELTTSEKIEISKQFIGDDATVEQINEFQQKVENGLSTKEKIVDLNSEDSIIDTIDGLTEQPDTMTNEEKLEYVENLNKAKPNSHLQNETGESIRRPADIENEKEIEELEKLFGNRTDEQEQLLEEEDEMMSDEKIEEFQDGVIHDMKNKEFAPQEEMREIYGENFKETFGENLSRVLEIMETIDVLVLFESILFILALVLFAYIIYKRLTQTWRDGGVILPLYPVPFILDLSKLAPGSDSHFMKTAYFDTLFRDHEATLFNRKKFKKNPQKFLQKKMKNVELLENVNYKIQSETRFFAYKRDPRLDGGLENATVEEIFFSEIYNTYDGWIYWKIKPAEPITHNQVGEIYFNLCMAMAIMYDQNHGRLSYVEKLDGKNMESGDPFDFKQQFSPQLDDFSAHVVPDQHDLVDETEHYISRIFTLGAYDKYNYDYIKYNSGINITLVNFQTAVARKQLGFKLRTEDLWYLIPSIYWEKKKISNIVVYELHPSLRGKYGFKKVKLKDGFPIPVGEAPARMWELSDEDKEHITRISNTDDVDKNDNTIIHSVLTDSDISTESDYLLSDSEKEDLPWVDDLDYDSD